MTDHIWTASQPQATMTYEVSEDNPAPVKIEVNNFVQYNYSSGCVKGSWTGDYFEFDVPVRNFKAGTEVTLTLPEGFAAAGADVYIKHEASNGKTYYYTSTVRSGNATARRILRPTDSSR